MDTADPLRSTAASMLGRLAELPGALVSHVTLSFALLAVLLAVIALIAGRAMSIGWGNRQKPSPPSTEDDQVLITMVRLEQSGAQLRLDLDRLATDLRATRFSQKAGLATIAEQRAADSIHLDCINDDLVALRRAIADLTSYVVDSRQQDHAIGSQSGAEMSSKIATIIRELHQE